MALRTLDEHEAGLTWVLDEPLARASQALVADGGVWLVDPVDEPEAIARAQALGTVTGVIQLMDRHNRDGAALAQRLGVALHRLPRALADTPFELVPTVSTRLWNELALWWPQRRVLVTADVVGTHPMWALTGRVGVHPMLRLRPPKVLARFEPEHLLVGHGPPVHGPETAGELQDALRHSVRDLPRLALRLPEMIRAGRG